MTVIFSNQIMCFTLGFVQVNYYQTTILMIISYRSSYRFRFLAGNFALISWVFSCNNWKGTCFGLVFRLWFSVVTCSLISWVFSCICWKWTGFDLVKRKLGFRLNFNFSKNFRCRIIFDFRPYLKEGWDRLYSIFSTQRRFWLFATQTVSFFYTVEHSHTEEEP